MNALSEPAKRAIFFECVRRWVADATPTQRSFAGANLPWIPKPLLIAVGSRCSAALAMARYYLSPMELSLLADFLASALSDSSLVTQEQSRAEARRQQIRIASGCPRCCARKGAPCVEAGEVRAANHVERVRSAGYVPHMGL